MPIQFWRGTTIDAARAMKLDRKSGSIAPGKTADVFVVDGNPLARIEDLARVERTMKAGVLYDSALLVGLGPAAK